MRAFKVARGSAKRRKSVVSKLITDRHLFWGEEISKLRYRIALPEELISITETDQREFRQKTSHYRYRYSLKFQVIPLQIQILGSKRINSVIISATA